MYKLHLGCGSVHIDGYINVDSDILSGADVIDDIKELREFEDNSVEEIYACNVLEHLGRFDYPMALARWYELLKDGGKLRLSVPDFRAICEYYLETGDLKSLYPALYAGQNTSWNFHYWCWDFETLKDELESIGFRDIKRIGCCPVRDWSTNFVPYRKDGYELPDDEWFKGKFIALNIEGEK